MTAHSTAIEHSGGLSLLQAVHAAFPLAQLDSYSDVLLRRGKSSKVRISRIFKPGAPLWVSFRRAQEAFTEVVALGSALAPPAENAINFAGVYSGCRFKEIEIDCLVKLPAPAGSIWTRDQASASDLFHIRATGHEPLAPAPPPAAAAAAGGRPALPAGAFDDKLSTITALHYPPGATHYVIGEAYGTLNLEGAGASTPIQKLLQLERILCFILEKKRKPVADICSCVLGVVLIGPSMDSGTCAAVFAALSHYQSSLQRLWALSEAGRLLAIRLQPLVAQLLLGLQRVGAGVARVVTRVEAATARADAATAELSAKLDKLLALQAAGSSAAGGGGGGHRVGGGGGHHSGGGGGGRGYRGGGGRGRGHRGGGGQRGGL